MGSSKRHDEPKSKRRAITTDDLWALDRLGEPSLSPDGRLVVIAVTTPSMKHNQNASALWLLSTQGDAPRRLTHAGEKDALPRFSPRGDLIAFTAKREQQGAKDDEAQLYVIAPDGGEARRVGEIATGVEGFRWLPDGKRIAYVSWVWPDAQGAKAQAKRHKQQRERKETGYATSEALWRFWDHNVPHGRAAHLHVVDLDGGRPNGKVRDLFAGTGVELFRAEPDAGSFDVSPDGKRIAFAHDPAREKRLDNVQALAEIDIATRRITPLAVDKAWDCTRPAYSPDGQRVAFVASHQGRKHTMPQQLAIVDRATRRWEVVSEAWDHEVDAPLLWSEDASAIFFACEQKGQRHIWRFDIASRRAEVVAEGSWVEGFDHAAGSLVSVISSASHPARVHAHLPGCAPVRIETFNDALMRKLAIGRVEERWFEGAQGDPVQMWLAFPPGFDDGAMASSASSASSASAAKAKRSAGDAKAKAKKTWPLLHSIHGGPHTSVGDAWHQRWNTQVFAAQGYVVCQVNYHGSTGFGYAFKDSITHRWGELELADVEAATDTLLAEPWVDRKRVYASGGSYGGYMVAWMNGHVAPGRYAAYVCHAGCYDWTATFASDAWSWFPKELGAWYWDDTKLVARQSPVAFAQNMKTPTLVIHGLLDYRVPDAQGLAYYHTLKARGVDARLLWYPDENHWILKPRNSKQWYEEFFAWLARHPMSEPRADAKRTKRKAA
jgi:dipeptidyl aminopeptidase/acylaminoacyl peptidase